MNFSLDSDFDSIEDGLDRITMIKELKNNRYKQNKNVSKSTLSQQRHQQKPTQGNLDLAALSAFTNNQMSLRRDRVDAINKKADLTPADDRPNIKKSVQFQQFE